MAHSFNEFFFNKVAKLRLGFKPNLLNFPTIFAAENINLREH